MRAQGGQHLRAWSGARSVALLVAAASGQAPAADLIDHNGFEACWSQAIAKPVFLYELYFSIEGAPGCISASNGDPSICNTSNCTPGVPGCPVTLHAGVFSGDFGSGDFNGPGSIDDFSTQVTMSGITCTASISGMTVAYAPAYSLSADGNNGVYAGALNDVQITVPQNAISITGGFGCAQAANSFAGYVAQNLGNAIHAAATATLAPATVGESVCPLSP